MPRRETRGTHDDQQYARSLQGVYYIDDSGKDEGVELKDGVNLAFQEFFERRQYLPYEET
jgi:hypothetical protein